MHKPQRTIGVPAYFTALYRDERHVSGEDPNVVTGCKYWVSGLSGTSDPVLLSTEDIWSVNDPSAWNSCLHYKMTFDRTSGPAYFVTEAAPSWFTRYSDVPEFWFANWSPPNLFKVGYGYATTLQSGSYGSLVNTLSADAFRAMLPGLRSNLSILNTLYELKDMRTLRTSGNRIKSMISAFSKLIKLSGRVGKYSTLKSLTRLVADQLLQQQFNVQPLVSDIVAFYNALRSYKSEVARILGEEGRLLKRHYCRDLSSYFGAAEYSALLTSCPIYYSNDGVSGWTCYNACGANWGVSETSYTGKESISYGLAKFNATLECRYDLSAFEREHAQTLGFLDKLGVNLNPAIIWNALPWSFVVDWFLGVSEWLDSFKTRNIEPRTCIHRYCWSVKLVKYHQRVVSHTAALHNAAQTNVPMGRVTERYYSRNVVAPPTLQGWIESSGMSLQEFILGSALLGTRWR